MGLDKKKDKLRFLVKMSFVSESDRTQMTYLVNHTGASGLCDRENYPPPPPGGFINDSKGLE